MDESLTAVNFWQCTQCRQWIPAGTTHWREQCGENKATMTLDLRACGAMPRYPETPPDSLNADGSVTIDITQGIKHDDQKLRYDLIPPGPLAELVNVYTIGAKKYSDRNWEKGIAWGRIFAAMMRHAWKYWNGEERDPEDGQSHLASVAWCAFALMQYEKTHKELDDRPTPHSVPE